MDGEILKASIKTIYGVVPYSGTAMLAMIWIGIAIASMQDSRVNLSWFMLACSLFGYVGLFLMLAIIASGNVMFGLEANAWINRTFAMLGFVFGMLFTGLYLGHRWRTRAVDGSSDNKLLGDVDG